MDQTNKQTNGQWGRSKKRAGDKRDPGEKMRALHVARAARIFNRPQRQSRAQSSPAPRSAVGRRGELWGHEKNMIFLIGSQ